MKINREYVFEQNNAPSCTDPSQNIELRIIVDRFVKGLPIPTVGHVLTPDDFDDPDNDYCPPESMDLSEVKDLVDSANQQVVSSMGEHEPPADITPRGVERTGGDEVAAV